MEKLAAQSDTQDLEDDQSQKMGKAGTVFDSGNESSSEDAFDIENTVDVPEAIHEEEMEFELECKSISYFYLLK